MGSHILRRSIFWGVVVFWVFGPRAEAEQIPVLTPAQLQKVESVAQSDYWLRLLHYKSSWLRLGARRSLLDGPEFYFSPDGKTDPKAELLATVAAFTDSEKKVGSLKQSPVCAFPERFRFLAQELGLPPHTQECREYNDYLKKFNAVGASLVFSTAYPNNPGSMFGHTFLKFNSGQKSEILDYGVNFAAVVPPDENGFAFVWFGLTGGYLGRFSAMPYYVKVNEYVNAESRDLWEYELDLNAEQTNRMLAHLWELETTTWFDYYFFDENCAFQLLMALEVARPDWDLSQFGVHVIPAETVKRVTRQPGAVRSIRFRPSLRRRLFEQFTALPSSERGTYSDLIAGKTDLGGVQSAPVLDAAITALQYEKQKSEGKLEPTRQNLQQSLLVRRSQLGVTQMEAAKRNSTQSEQVDPAAVLDRPDLGHYPHRLSLGVGAMHRPPGVGNFAAFFQELGFKFAYHDLMNSDRGYIRFSQIDFPHLMLRYTYGSAPAAGLALENLSFLTITSLFPLSFLEKKPSWRFHADLYRPRDFGCDQCLVLRAEGGVGASFSLFSETNIFYTLLQFKTEFGSGLGRGWRLGPELTAATIWNFFEPLKLRLSVSGVSDLFQPDRPGVLGFFEAEASVALSQWTDLRLGWNTWLGFQQFFQEAKLNWNLYF